MKTFVHALTLGLATTAAASLLAQAPAQKPAPAASRFVAIGCISLEAQPAAGASRGSAAARYQLTDNRGDKPTIYRLEGDVKQLDLHVGHTVEVAGALSAAPAGGGGPNAGAPVLKVSSLVWISTKCSK